MLELRIGIGRQQLVEISIRLWLW